MTLYEEVHRALSEPGFRPKKNLGQNFVVQERVIASILQLLELSPQDEILEIGPGLGFLTRRLAEVAAKVWAVEIDDFLAAWLRRSPLGEHPAVQLIHDDILRVSPENFLPPHKAKVAANLPYSISTPVLFRLFDWREHFSTLVLMLQKEVADRMISPPGSKTYGTLSVWSRVHGRITEKVSVSPEAFFPRPKVRSTVLKIELFEQPLVAGGDLPALRGLVRAAFGQRRKTLRNALAGWLKTDRAAIESFLAAREIDPKRRGETLTVEEFIRLAQGLKQFAPELT